MLIQSVSSARRKSLCIIGLSSVALGTKVGAAVTLGTVWMNVTARATARGIIYNFGHVDGEWAGIPKVKAGTLDANSCVLCHVMRRTDVFQIRIEPELRDRLARLRDERHVNISAWARDVIAAALDREFPGRPRGAEETTPRRLETLQARRRLGRRARRTRCRRPRRTRVDSDQHHRQPGRLLDGHDHRGRLPQPAAHRRPRLRPAVGVHARARHGWRGGVPSPPGRTAVRCDAAPVRPRHRCSPSSGLGWGGRVGTDRGGVVLPVASPLTILRLLSFRPRRVPPDGPELVADDVGERRLDDLARMVRLLGRPVPERRPEAMGHGRDVAVLEDRGQRRAVELPSRRPGNTSGLPPLSSVRAASRISMDRPHSGPRCAQSVFMRAAGTVHTSAFVFISDHCAPRTSPERAAVTRESRRLHRQHDADASSRRLRAGAARTADEHRRRTARGRHRPGLHGGWRRPPRGGCP